VEVAPIPDGKPSKKGYSATAIADLELRATPTGDLAGDHLIEFRVLAPGGYLYQSMVSPFNADATAAGATQRKVHGYPHALKVQKPRAKGGKKAALLVTGVLPVGGTSITTASLYGEWTVEAYLDGTEAACGSAGFQIVP
jgi:hypothetical protein